MSAPAFVAVGFLLGLPVSWMAIHVGQRLRLLDLPVGIKVHRLPIPYTGGAAIAATLAIAGMIVELPLTILLGGLFMWLVGLADDIRSLPPPVKLLLEVPPLVIGASALGLEPLLFIGVVVLGVFLVNCFNVIDGLDGLAAAVAMISLLALLWRADGTVVPIAGVLVGASLAFLLFNLHPARLFLGDEGSLLLGYFLWILPLTTFAQHRDVREFLFGALLWGFPLANVAFVVTKRLVERRPVLVGQRDHLYDVLHVRLGLRSTLLICWSIAALSSVAAAAVMRG